MPRYRRRASDRDDATPARRPFADFVNVENRREEPFPEEFAEGPYGAPPRDEGEGGGPAAGAAPDRRRVAEGPPRPRDRRGPRPPSV